MLKVIINNQINLKFNYEKTLLLEYYSLKIQ